MCVTPSATSQSPAKKEMVRRKLTCVGSRAVTLHWCRDQDKKKPDEKKLELIGERGSLESDSERKKEEKKCNKDPQPARQKEKKKKTKETKKKKWKRKKSTKVGIHIPPSPHCTRI